MQQLLGNGRPTVQRCGDHACDCEDATARPDQEVSVQRLSGEDFTAGIGEEASSGQVVTPGQASGGPILTVGSAGQLVAALQSALNEQVSPVPPLTVDGVFGGLTQSAVVGFQQGHGLVADGIAGPRTLAALALVPGGGGSGAGQASAGCPPYTDDELKTSRDSGGRFDELPSVGPTVAGAALMWDFRPGKADIRPVHITGAQKFIIDLALDTATPRATVSLFEGHSDCVAGEGINSSLREGRAHAARNLFLELGALPQNIGTARAATTGEPPGADKISDRARNRSAVVVTSVVLPSDGGTPGPGTIPPRKRACDANADPGTKWSLQQNAGAGVAGGIGFEVIAFELKNRVSGCVYQCLYLGFGGGAGFGASLSAPGAVKFTTTQAVNPNDFEKGGAGHFTAGVSFGVEITHAFIRFKGVETTPKEIDLGGLGVSEGTNAGVIGTEGSFSVEDTGIRRAADL